MNIKYINELKQIPHKYPWLTSLYALILQFKPKNIYPIKISIKIN